MSDIKQTDGEPSYEELEEAFVNNEPLDRIEAYLNRFNPIKTMKMERMEIRHSAILAWLLDPSETHGLGDHFLKAFISEALRGHNTLEPTALDISQSDLRDAEIRCEWQNIDIFILSQANNWAFIVENKFDSSQYEGQLTGYMSTVNAVYEADRGALKIRGIFLTLEDEDPEDKAYAPIRYELVSEILQRMVTQHVHRLSPEVSIFLNHYLDVLKEATGMSEELKKMETLARQLYRDHKKALDFVIKHGVSTDFAIAARSQFGDNLSYLDEITIEENRYVFGDLGSSNANFIPHCWYEAFGGEMYDWPGCENFGTEYPLNARFQLVSGNDDVKGQLRLHAEIGPLSDYGFRKALIESVQGVAEDGKLNSIRFQRGAADEGKRYSKFLKRNTVEIKDVHDSEEISMAMVKLLKKFQSEFEAIAAVLPQFLKFGKP